MKRTDLAIMPMATAGGPRARHARPASPWIAGFGRIVGHVSCQYGTDLTNHSSRRPEECPP